MLLKIVALLALSLWPVSKLIQKYGRNHHTDDQNFDGARFLGVDTQGYSHVYHARHDSPEESMNRAIEAMGGINEIIGPRDIVVIKPNAQWWNQGMTNTDTLCRFIEIVLSIPGFQGEIILAENHHFPENNSRAWTTEQRNGRFNYNELIAFFQEKGFANVTKYHWNDGGPSVPGLHGGAENGGIVRGPQDGDGYVWCHDLVYRGNSGYKTLMSYPVFTSRYSGITIDLKNGAWKDGNYIDTPVKLINFSSLNHHGTWAGATASVKNYLGIVDLTCGYRGTQPEGFMNFHFIGVRPSRLSKIHWRLEFLRRKLKWGYLSHFDGGAVGYFMKNVRFADLNIIAAEWTGWGSRVDTALRAHTKSVLISKDPVALDYYACKNILLPVTPENAVDKKHNYAIYGCNDPDGKDSRLGWYLQECHGQGIGNLNPARVKIHKTGGGHA